MVRFRDAPLAAQGASPPLGRDSAAILDQLGYDADRVSDLQERGIIA
jgi:crotonobetainyl-CoA:carnitine CoA-transferase CaiB-like acyl-CoA transferase